MKLGFWKSLKKRFVMWLMDWEIMARCPECWMPVHTQTEYKEHYQIAHKEELENSGVQTSQ